MCVCYLYVFAAHACLLPKEVRRGRWLSWDWSYWWLGTALWVLLANGPPSDPHFSCLEICSDFLRQFLSTRVVSELPASASRVPHHVWRCETSAPLSCVLWGLMWDVFSLPAGALSPPVNSCPGRGDLQPWDYFPRYLITNFATVMNSNIVSVLSCGLRWPPCERVVGPLKGLWPTAWESLLYLCLLWEEFFWNIKNCPDLYHPKT